MMREQSHLTQETADGMVKSVLDPLSDIADEAVRASSGRLLRRECIRAHLDDMSPDVGNPST
jgi:hypothetical protein